jgi:aspartyl/glutamyl-tRNA(Asn/Gln) amidotransferase C subunit
VKGHENRVWFLEGYASFGPQALRGFIKRSLLLTGDMAAGTMTARTCEEVSLSRDPHKQNEEIDRSIFDHLVDLAAFHLEPEEKEYLREELNAQLNAIRELEALDVGEGVAITSHGVPYTEEISSPLRADVVEVAPEANDIVAGAPETELRYIVVPDIPHEELE